MYNACVLLVDTERDSMIKKIISALAVAVVAMGVGAASQVQASPWEARNVMTKKSGGDMTVRLVEDGCGSTYSRVMGTLNVAQDKLLCAKPSSAYYASKVSLAAMGYTYIGTTADMYHIWVNPTTGTKYTYIVKPEMVGFYQMYGYKNIATVGFDLGM